jgi:hydroxymethylpyrimidine pyrophosphatase-like HAD family hydrolase
MKNVLAFGDNYNDIEMLKSVGLGVAVANAIEEVLQIANKITDTNKNDGVAKVIRELF